MTKVYNTEESIIHFLTKEYKNKSKHIRAYKLIRLLSLSQSVLRYMIKFKKVINLRNPKDLNQKIIWLAFNNEDLSWTMLADKLGVHDYLKALNLYNLSVPVYKVWNRAEDIDFSLLPNSFVIKTNHGCGDVFVVKDKNKVDENIIKKKLDYYMHKPYGLVTGEPHYLRIKPYVFAEKILDNDSTLSSSIIDYKFFCFHGEPKCVLVCYDRKGLSAQKIVYDLEWNIREDLTSLSNDSIIKHIPKPKSFDVMVDACRKLGKPFDFTRIDFYESGEKPYFGEMTFTPAAGRSTALSQKALDWLGSFIYYKK